MNSEKLLSMKVSKVYPLYLQKVLRKGRTQQELDEVIQWLTGYDIEALQSIIANEITFQDFFLNAPLLNPNKALITGAICGIKVESILNPMIQNIRYLDKLVDELAKGRPLEKIFRK